MSGQPHQSQPGEAWQHEVKTRAAELDRLFEDWLEQTQWEPERLQESYRAQARHPAVQATVQALLDDHPAASAFFSNDGLLLDDVMPPASLWRPDDLRDVPAQGVSAIQRRLGRTV